MEIGLDRGWVGRLSYTGVESYELYVPADMAMAAHEALVAAGATHAGLFATGSLRIESGFCAFGHELTPGTTPDEAGLGRFCPMGTDFVGKQALTDHTPNRRIVPLLFEDADAIPIHDEPICYGGKVVGQITSAAWSYRFDRSVALAIVNAPLDRLDTEAVVNGVEVEIACKRFPACASFLPAREAF